MAGEYGDGSYGGVDVVARAPAIAGLMRPGVNPRCDIDGLVQHTEKLARGRRSKAVRKHIGYFRNNRERMQYSTFKKVLLSYGRSSF